MQTITATRITSTQRKKMPGLFGTGQSRFSPAKARGERGHMVSRAGYANRSRDQEAGSYPLLRLKK